MGDGIEAGDFSFSLCPFFDCAKHIKKERERREIEIEKRRKERIDCGILPVKLQVELHVPVPLLTLILHTRALLRTTSSTSIRKIGGENIRVGQMA